MDIEHVGSTAIPGMSAKPIIDIMIGVESLVASVSLIPVLKNAGYCYFPYKKDIMHWFCKPSPEYREYHLYLIPRDSHEWRARTAFRDYLRAHPKAAQDYLKLKQSLARQFRNDREAYTAAKAAFVAGIVTLAGKA